MMMIHNNNMSTTPKRVRIDPTASSTNTKRFKYGPSDVYEPTNHVLPHTLDTIQFIQSHQRELSYTIQSIQTNQQLHNKRLFQLLPRYMRRRSMSYNIHKYPKWLRYKAKHELQQSNTKPKKVQNNSASNKLHHIKRYQQRRSDYMLCSHQLKWCQSIENWLELHIYYAKRCHMISQWNYKLPYSNIQKSIKFIMKSVQNTCVVYDNSYIQCIELQCSNINRLAELLQQYTGETILLPQQTSTTMQYCNMYVPNTTQLIQSDVQYQWIIDSENSYRLWLWLHPSAYNYIHSLLQHYCTVPHNITITPLYNQFNRYQLFGNQCHHVLTQTLQCMNNTTLDNELWNTIKHYIRTPGSLPQNAIIKLHINNNELMRYNQSFIVPHNNDVMVLDKPNNVMELSDQQISNAQNALLQCNISTQPSDLYSTELRQQLILSTKHGKRMNRYNKLFYDTNIPHQYIAAHRYRIKKPHTDITSNNEPQPHTTPKPSTTSPNCHPHILLIQRTYFDRFDTVKSNGKLYSYELIVPAGWSQSIVHALTYSGARLACMQDIQRIFIEYNINCYPYNNIDTISGALLQQYITYTQQQLHLRRPSHVQINYNKFGIKYPFGELQSWIELLQLNDTHNIDDVMKHINQSIDNEINHELCRRKKLLYNKSNLALYHTEHNIAAPEFNMTTPNISRALTSVQSVPVELCTTLSSYSILPYTIYNDSINKLHTTTQLSTILIPVTVTMTYRGVPDNHSMIAIPTDSDIQQFIHNVKWPGVIQPRIKQLNHTIKYNKLSEQLIRTTIGYIQSGIHSLLYGKGIGTGYITGHAALQLNTFDEKYRIVLIRNPTSMYYQPAYIKYKL